MPFPPLVEPVEELGDIDVRRHARQLILAEIGALGQRRLKNGRVLVIGADEVGAPALGHLADAGVGVLGIADGAPLRTWDRCPGRPGPDGRPVPQDSRAAAWAAALRETHPAVTVVTHRTRLDAGTAEEVLRDYDVVLCASEDPARCYLVDDVCARLGKPFVWGGVDRLRGRVGVFWDAHGPTYRDLHPAPPAPYFRGMAGFLEVLGGWLSAALAVEAVKLLTGGGEPLVGRITEYDALSGGCRTVPLERDPAAVRPAELTAAEPYFGLLSPEAAEAAREHTISVDELKDLLDREVPLYLVDVREPDEHAFSDLPGSVLIPKGEFFDGGAAVERLPDDRKVVFFCRMGIRSAEVLAVARKSGHPDAVHLGGGIVEWAERVDPGMPVY
ncbi:ThiF family adenylyltransferase [Streptomyces sp. NPDC001922]|uniref:ThiF family adenylyltransferase n=1 Tax=Streptomyces sp. NPDC001922 TaxID=3364624 RepID=UPI0036A6335F